MKGKIVRSDEFGVRSYRSTNERLRKNNREIVNSELDSELRTDNSELFLRGRV